MLASAFAVLASVLLGVFSDQRGHRRRSAVITCLCATAGIAMIVIHPGCMTFWIGHGILVPAASSVYGQLFTLARLASLGQSRGRDQVLGGTGSLLSAGFFDHAVGADLCLCARGERRSASPP